MKVEPTTKVQILIAWILIFSSCDRLKNNEEKPTRLQNQLVVTVEGDSLENGFWTYEKGLSGVAQHGTYQDGFKIGQWVYKLNSDSVVTTWRTINDNLVKFNVPDRFKVVEDIQAPILFQADVEDGDANTFVVLLRYDLKTLNSSVYNYLFQFHESWKKNSQERLKSEDFKKFHFKGIEIFRSTVQTERKIDYLATSYIFVVKDFLYDLTYKNAVDKSTQIDSEIFNDILYSMECENVDLFNYNNRKYFKEEKIEFRSNESN